MFEISGTARTVERCAENTFSQLRDSHDSFIVMGVSEVEFGARAVQVVCLQARTEADRRRQLELEMTREGGWYVQSVVADSGGAPQTFPTMQRSTRRPRYDVVGTGTNVSDVCKALSTPRGRRQQVPRFGEMVSLLEPEAVTPHRPQVTGVISYNRGKTIVYGFAARRRGSNPLATSVELLTQTPIELTFREKIRPGIGLMVTDAVHEPDKPLPPLPRLLRPTLLRGNCEEIANAYGAQLAPNSLVAVKMFDAGSDYEYAVLSPNRVE